MFVLTVFVLTMFYCISLQQHIPNDDLITIVITVNNNAINAPILIARLYRYSHLYSAYNLTTDSSVPNQFIHHLKAIILLNKYCRHIATG